MWGTNTERSVVVVDDDPECRTLHRLWLDGGYDVRTASSGEDALETVDDGTDVVVLDREMPGLPGTDVIERLRTRGYDGGVVVASGVEPDVDVQSLAAEAYLVKPISEGELRDAVERAWSRRAYSAQLRDLFALAARKARLEVEKDRPALVRSDEYHALETKLATKRTEITAAMERGDSDWTAAFEACAGDPTSTHGT